MATPWRQWETEVVPVPTCCEVERGCGMQLFETPDFCPLPCYLKLYSHSTETLPPTRMDTLPRRPWTAKPVTEWVPRPFQCRFGNPCVTTLGSERTRPAVWHRLFQLHSFHSTATRSMTRTDTRSILTKREAPPPSRPCCCCCCCCICCYYYHQQQTRAASIDASIAPPCCCRQNWWSCALAYYSHYETARNVVPDAQQQLLASSWMASRLYTAKAVYAVVMPCYCRERNGVIHCRVSWAAFVMDPLVARRLVLENDVEMKKC